MGVCVNDQNLLICRHNFTLLGHFTFDSPKFQPKSY